MKGWMGLHSEYVFFICFNSGTKLRKYFRFYKYKCKNRYELYVFSEICNIF